MERTPRNQVPMEQTWDLESLYPTQSAWETDLRRAEELLGQASQFHGRLQEGAGVLLACLKWRDQVGEVTDRVQFYAFNRANEDQDDPARQELADRARGLAARHAAALSFLKPELLALPDGLVDIYLQAEPGLAIYRYWLSDVLAMKEHMLTAEGEAVLAELTELLLAPYSIWESVTYADIKFDPVADDQGNQVPMSLSAMLKLLQSPDRSVRQAAYESAARAFLAHKRGIAAAFSAAQKRDVIVARLRRYPSSLAAALAPDHLPEKLYYNLLRVAEEGSVHVRRYMEFRRRGLKVERLMPWDLLAPLDADLDTNITFSDGFAMVLRAAEPLGPQYQAILEQAWRGRWCDWADNKGKAGGAYSWGVYGYHPIILLNWNGKIADVFTLAHELGHAAHSVLSQKQQPFVYAGYPLFLAEIASTTNELLLADYLLGTTSERALRRYVLTRALGAFTSNFFGAAAGAAFQLEVHQLAEQGVPLTHERITSVNEAILKRWYGDAYEITPDGAAATWQRAPHHFENFYSYQYATGIAAAAAFSDAVRKEGAPAVERYLGFLRAGSSDRPLEILKRAGVDLTSPDTLERAVGVFARFVDEIESMGTKK